MAVVVDCSLNDGEPEDAAGIVGEGTWMVVGQESLWQMEWRNNYVGHQTDADMVQRDSCEVVRGYGLCCGGSCNDVAGSMMGHLHCYGLAACEDVGVSQHDTHPVV